MRPEPFHDTLTPVSERTSHEMTTTDGIWRALANQQRRSLLAALRDGPKTTTELVERFPELTRFAVMKHIAVLREIDLVRTREDGPRRINSLNAVPLRMLYEELVDGYQDLWARQLIGVKRHAEQRAREPHEAKRASADSDELASSD